MEPLSDILKSHSFQKASDQLAEIKKKLASIGVVCQSIKLQHQTLTITMQNHIEAAETKYKQQQILTTLSQYEVKKIQVIAA